MKLVGSRTAATAILAASRTDDGGLRLLGKLRRFVR
jgi:hypothetical protein